MDDEIWQQIRETNRLGNRKIFYYETIDSTNLKASDIGKAGATAGTIVLADSQTKGRGRLERFWQSPAGTGLYFSLIWHSHLPPEHLSKITLAAGLGLCKGVSVSTNLKPLIKWPNDLLLDGKKVGGILTENLGKSESEDLIIIGVGLNVNTHEKMFATDLLATASSLHISSQKKFSRGDILMAVVTAIEFELSRLKNGEALAVLADLRDRDATYGKRMTWITPTRKVINGVSLGIDERGMLQVQDNKGKIHEVLSGDLSLAN